jgi:hypothetical protein
MTTMPLPAPEPPEVLPGRIVLVGNAEPMEVPDEREVSCERCKGRTFINKYQLAKMVEINLRYSWAPVTAGGKSRPPMAVFCHPCAIKLGIKSRAVPIKMKENHG